MKYLNLSVFSMIFTAFVMKVVQLVRGKKHPGLAPFGITPEEWEHAMAHAKLYRDMEIVLGFDKRGGNGLEWIIGPSLGEEADRLVMNWCWNSLVSENGYFIRTITRRPVLRGDVPNRNPAQWPLTIEKWADMINMYNALMNQASIRERVK